MTTATIFQDCFYLGWQLSLFHEKFVPLLSEKSVWVTETSMIVVVSASKNPEISLTGLFEIRDIDTRHVYLRSQPIVGSRTDECQVDIHWQVAAFVDVQLPRNLVGCCYVGANEREEALPSARS